MQNDLQNKSPVPGWAMFISAGSTCFLMGGKLSERWRSRL